MTSMPLDIDRFSAFYRGLRTIDLYRPEPGVLPPLTSVFDLNRVITRGAAYIPRVYRKSYLSALQENLPYILASLENQPQANWFAWVEPLCAPIYQHAPNQIVMQVWPQLRRFTAVVSNLYRSFTNANKRASLNIPLVSDTPPLAFFQSYSSGPYTIPSDVIERLLGAKIGIVSLPAAYRDHPVLWATLTHEVCGHDVVHADVELIPELVQGIRSVFTTGPIPSRGELTPDALYALLWSYWVDEATSDVYGVLNLGPTFALNMTAFLASLETRAGLFGGLSPPQRPRLRTETVVLPDGSMDRHPTDILRLYLAIGVIENLHSLSEDRRNEYVAFIQAVAAQAADGVTEVRFSGKAEINHANWREISTTVPLADAATAARRVGKYIATAQLKALGGNSIQVIETWDDADEETARYVADRIAKGQAITRAADDAQLLAGAMLALINQPELYAVAAYLLNAALDDSYRRDPIWRAVGPGSFFG